jgi:hypothetical protein
MDKHLAILSPVDIARMVDDGCVDQWPIVVKNARKFWKILDDPWGVENGPHPYRLRSE